MDDNLPDAVWQGNANINAEQVARELITALAAITGGQEGTELPEQPTSMVPKDLLAQVIDGAGEAFTVAKETASGLVTTAIGLVMDLVEQN